MESTSNVSQVIDVAHGPLDRNVGELFKVSSNKKTEVKTSYFYGLPKKE